MMQDWGKRYQRYEFPALASSPLVAWFSPAVADPHWDAFLQGTPCGQFQQSSMWAEYKVIEGWNHHRLILTGANEITGGFQILWRKTKLGRIGYVSKGPVAWPESTTVMHLLESLLVRVVKELGLIALLTQPPDEARDSAEPKLNSGFVTSNPMGIIEATYLVDVRTDLEELRRRISPSLRKNIRKARKQPMTVREGTEADIPRFYELMVATCRRQRAKPNPSSLEAVRLLWRAFTPTNSIWLTFIEYSDGLLAAQLCLVFNNRVTLWKKGWDGSHGQWHPNELLEVDILERAQARGLRLCDFCSLNRSTAEEILDGQAPKGASLSSRDQFTLRFGGMPRLLPRARVFWPNPVLRFGYRNTYALGERLWR